MIISGAGVSSHDFPSASSSCRLKSAEGFQTMLQQILNGQEKDVRSNDDTYSTIPVSGTMAASLFAVQGTVEASSESAAQGGSHVIHIDGVAVITSGHSLDHRDGMSFFQTIPEDGSGLFSQLTAFAQANEAAADSGNSGAVTGEESSKMTVVETRALGPLPLGITSPYVDIDVYETAGSLGAEPIPSEAGAEADSAYSRSRTEAFIRMSDVERKLKAQYGGDIKLIYSYIDDGYIMLTPDDARYSEMNGVIRSVPTVYYEGNKGAAL